jgi:ribosomal protein L23|eukprot:TRINITY_DN12363_c0_g1_i1.p1 TRINITY_DN12363_c0_g1~~TRINITY_DN12363_c0_g1_i1.p1  ORF type:complete len:180 (+),score=51.01 TRINITY_DN12363_c0_g1_i1:37-576(+)
MGRKQHFRWAVSKPIRPTTPEKKGNWRRKFFPDVPFYKAPDWQKDLPSLLFNGPLSFRELTNTQLPRRWIQLHLSSVETPTMEPTFRCPLELSKPDIRHLLKEFYGIEAEQIRTSIYRGRAYTDPETMEKKKAPDYKRAWVVLDRPVCLSLGTTNPAAASRQKVEEFIESTRVKDDDDL